MQKKLFVNKIDPNMHLSGNYPSLNDSFSELNGSYIELKWSN